MRPAVAQALSPLGVERQFETNRLALDHQARGYEEAFPIAGPFQSKAARDQVEIDVNTVVETDVNTVVSEKGVAA